LALRQRGCARSASNRADGWVVTSAPANLDRERPRTDEADEVRGDALNPVVYIFRWNFPDHPELARALEQPNHEI
jgi:hypothetical protein